MAEVDHDDARVAHRLHGPATVNPVVAVLLGTATLGEALSWRTLAGGLVVLSAVALIVSRPRLRSPRAAVAVPARGR